MMRTIEVMLIIIIILGAFLIASFFAVLPSPREVSPLNLRRLALTTLEMLDADHSLSEIVFKPPGDPSWGELQVALSACLPPNVIYNLTVYEVQSGSETELYSFVMSISNAESLGVGSDAASYLVASSNVTFRFTPEKIGESGVGGTLYILNCSDARGWWITGYTAHSLAQDLYNLLSPYFVKTVMVQNTTDLGKILNGISLQGETVQNAVIINTFGEAVPIPSGYYATQGYDSQHTSYAKYCYILGQKVRGLNWTWVSMVGYPLYYVSNINAFPNDRNSYGIYGMKDVGPAGLNAFLDGLENKEYGDWWWDDEDECWKYDNDWITESFSESVYLSSEALYYCNYYGIYPSPYQTSTRAINKTELNAYHNLTVRLLIFNEKNGCYPGALYAHMSSTRVEGSLLALGLTRTPDIRLTAIGLLSYYKPRLYRSEYTAANVTRLVILQLGQAGGV